MHIFLEDDVYDKIRAANCTDLSGKYVIAHRMSGTDTMGIPIEMAEVEGAEGYLVTENEGGTDGEDSVELGCTRYSTLGEAVHAMVNGVEGKSEVTFFTELCVDYGSCIDGIARWCHSARFTDGTRWF